MTQSEQESRTVRVIYTGRVQGVNFRWTTREIATGFPVKGFVRNLPDGTVELVACGPSDGVGDFLDAVASRFRSHITRADESPFVSDEMPSTFEIRH